VIQKLRRHQEGASAVEFALAAPVLITMMWGIFQFGVLFGSDAGMQHALGEGARFATIWPTPTDDQIKARMNDKLFKMGYGSFTVDNPSRDATTGSVNLRITYQFTPNLLFFTLPQVNLTRTKRAYVTDDPTPGGSPAGS
jgi:Flp pilus assembly protein TadG